MKPNRIGPAESGLAMSTGRFIPKSAVGHPTLDCGNSFWKREKENFRGLHADCQLYEPAAAATGLACKRRESLDL